MKVQGITVNIRKHVEMLKDDFKPVDSKEMIQMLRAYGYVGLPGMAGHEVVVPKAMLRRAAELLNEGLIQSTLPE